MSPGGEQRHLSVVFLSQKQPTETYGEEALQVADYLPGD